MQLGIARLHRKLIVMHIAWDELVIERRSCNVSMYTLKELILFSFYYTYYWITCERKIKGMCFRKEGYYRK